MNDVKAKLYIRDVPDSEHVFPIGESGQQIAGKVTDRMINSQYWGSKRKEISLVVIVCMGILLIMLLAESDILNVAWHGLLHYI